MPEINTRFDSVRIYLTGAGSDGGAQTDPDDSLGNYRSSTMVAGLTAQRSSSISNVTIDFAHWSNGEGTGQLRAVDANNLAWTPPGGTEGDAVTIANGETKILEGGDDPAQYIVVSRTSATALSGTESDVLTEAFNNAIGFDNVADAERSAGDTEYRCVCFRNGSASGITGLKVWVRGDLGTQLVSGTAQLGGSGSGTITVATGNFSDWPASGWCRIETSGGTLREIVYYTSRTSTSLTVPAAGRGQMGTSATAGAATDLIYAMSGIQIGAEAPSGSSSTGNATDNTGSGEGTAPGAVSFTKPIDEANGLSLGDLDAGEIYFLWIKRVIPAGATSAAEVLNGFYYTMNAA